MRIGVFGGTFDPVHLGHLILAEQCREQGRLDQVWFVPAARPPHKPDQPHAALPSASRCWPGPRRPARLSHRGTGERPPRPELHRRHADESTAASPATSFFCSWLRYAARFAALVRSGRRTAASWPSWSCCGPDMARLVGRRTGRALNCPTMCHCDSRWPKRRLSTSPAATCAAGRTGQESRYFLPRGVEAYILDKRLYRTV